MTKRGRYRRKIFRVANRYGSLETGFRKTVLPRTWDEIKAAMPRVSRRINHRKHVLYYSYFARYQAKDPTRWAHVRYRDAKGKRWAT